MPYLQLEGRSTRLSGYASRLPNSVWDQPTTFGLKGRRSSPTDLLLSAFMETHSRILTLPPLKTLPGTCGTETYLNS